MTYSLAGPFAAFAAGNGAWRLSAGAPSGPGVQILLRGTSADAARFFADAPRIERIVLDWSRDIVIVTLTVAGGIGALTAHSAIVHEPQDQLYRCLPLAEFDAGAQAFWRRVFRLLRLPGGRFLLGLMTRRERRSR
jgi:hypothetical protein